jgi:hypothetical protein
VVCEAVFAALKPNRASDGGMLRSVHIDAVGIFGCESKPRSEHPTIARAIGL